MPNGSHEPMFRHVTGSRLCKGDRREGVRLLVREGLKVDGTPRWFECSREGIWRRVDGCTSLVGGGGGGGVYLESYTREARFLTR
jgi:uncharacterized protein (DUF779 family)